MFQQIVDALSNIAELNENEQEKELEDYMSTLQIENEIFQDEESDSESYDSETEEQEIRAYTKLNTIKNESIDIFVCGPPCAGKSEFIHCLQKKLGGRIINKPSLTHVECRGSDSSELLKTYNLFKKFQEDPQQYCVAYATQYMLQQIIDSKSTLNLLKNKNTKYSFFENSPLDTISVLLEYCIENQKIDDIVYTAAKNVLKKLYYDATREAVFSRFKMYIFINSDKDVCRQRVEKKRNHLRNFIRQPPKNNNLTANTDPFATDSMNRLLNQTSQVSKEQKEFDCLELKKDFYEKIIELYNRLADAKDKNTRTKFGYKTHDSLTMTVSFPQHQKYESDEYHEKINQVTTQISKRIKERIKHRIANELTNQQREIIIRNTKRKNRNNALNNDTGATRNDNINNNVINSQTTTTTIGGGGGNSIIDLNNVDSDEYVVSDELNNSVSSNGIFSKSKVTIDQKNGIYNTTITAKNQTVNSNKED